MFNSHTEISWSNTALFQKRPVMSRTCSTFHPVISELNELDRPNINFIVSTLLTFHTPIGLLKADAFPKRTSMFITFETSQRDMSALKRVVLAKVISISRTLLTSQLRYHR